jgi:hypothetical protein
MTTLPPIWNISDPPAAILKQYLVDAGAGVDPTSSSDDWPIYVSTMPDDPMVKDKALAIFDTTGIHLARWLTNGQVYIKYGFQIQLRSDTYVNGFDRMKLVNDKLDAVKYTSQVYNSKTYQMRSVTRTSNIPLGQEPDKRRRQLFTINGLLSVIDSNV